MGILVKEWDEGTPSSGHPIFPYMNIPPLIITEMIDNNMYNWRYAEYSDENGLAGQGNNSNPKANFNLHLLVKAENVYYDPSYGKKYDDLNGMEQNIDGYYTLSEWQVDESSVGMDLNGDGNMTQITTVVYLISNSGNIVEE